MDKINELENRVNELEKQAQSQLVYAVKNTSQVMAIGNALIDKNLIEETELLKFVTEATNIVVDKLIKEGVVRNEEPTSAYTNQD